MTAPAEMNFSLPQGFDTQTLQAALHDVGDLEVARGRREPLEVLDNFPADIWRNGALLTRHRSGRLQWWQQGRAAHELEAPSDIRFWWQLPAGALRDHLAATIGLWSLQVVARLSVLRRRLVLRNGDGKIVVRGEWLELSDAAARLSLCALRGYAGEFEQARDALLELGAQPGAAFDLRQALIESEDAPEPINLKGPYAIRSGEPAEDAVRRMAVSMFAQARVFEPGVIEDLDTEFVHQYRVSLRKLRSLLGLMKSALPPELPGQVKQDLARMASAMGTLRDLDVFLLDQDDYREMLPAAFQDGFNQLLAQIHKDRQRALNATRRQLKSQAYVQRCAHLDSLLQASPSYVAAAALKPVGRIASGRILKRYQRIRQASLEVTAETPDEQVHEIRIECKKLRYMLEFFAELYPRARMKPLNRALKRLQDVLGRFNDVCVQQEFLAAYAQRSSEPAQSAAIYGLIAVLHQDQVRVRARVESELGGFAADEVAANFSAMFGRNRSHKT